MFGFGKYMPARQENDFPAPTFADFERFLDEWPRMNMLSPSTERLDAGFMPALDVHETDKSIEVTCELPGLDEKHIELSIDKDVLTIAGEKTCEHEQKGKGVFRHERRYGSFRRSISLPTGIDEDDIDAKFKNGILTITIPKGEDFQRKRRKIDIKT